MHVVLAREPADRARVVVVPDDGPAPEARTVAAAHLPDVVARLEPRDDAQPGGSRTPPRWTWDDTADWYPPLLAAGTRVDRAHDLRLAHRILRHSTLAAGSDVATGPPGPWDEPVVPDVVGPAAAVRAPQPDALFDLAASAPGPRRGGRGQVEQGTGDRAPAPDPLAALRSQDAAVASASEPGRLRLLLAAESAGALVAAEMRHAGLPWRADVHDAILTEALGPRPAEGRRPARLEQLVGRIRDALDAPPTLNPDSHPDLLKAMQYAGVGAKSLRKWELEKVQHPVVAPLLEYKNLYRLLTANGWHWLDTWVSDGRFRPEYVVGGVVTGRWASSGGGALQLPKAVRGAVVADPGWCLVVADAAQLEPRVLAGMSGDEAMAGAGRDGDLYAGIVASGAVATRELAKVGMLGALYGGTTGASGQVLPRLARTFPRAIALVEDAARTGERGGVVTTRLGRSSTAPGSDWDAAQAGALDDDAGADAAARARSATRAWGRFTRNFVVQGTAAEWALCWLASIRRRLWAMGPGAPVDGRAPAPFADRPHLVFFLHDEVVVHAPVGMAEEVAAQVRAAAAEAGTLLFGDFPVDFPLAVAAVDSYADAK